MAPSPGVNHQVLNWTLIHHFPTGQHCSTTSTSAYNTINENLTYAQPSITEQNLLRNKNNAMLTDNSSTTSRQHYDFTYDPSSQGTLPTTDHDLAARAAVAAQTEIGNPNGLIPTSQDTQRQLAAIHASELPVGPSRTANPGSSGGYHFHSGRPDTTQVTATDLHLADMVYGSLREHQESNYAPGYRRASEAVPQRTYQAEGHDAVSFPHEQLGSEQGSVTGSSRNVMPPELPPRTQGHDYALSSGDGTNTPARGGTNTGRSSPGTSVGSKVQEAFSQTHVSGHDLAPRRGSEFSGSFPPSAPLCAGPHGRVLTSSLY